MILINNDNNSNKFNFSAIKRRCSLVFPTMHRKIKKIEDAAINHTHVNPNLEQFSLKTNPTFYITNQHVTKRVPDLLFIKSLFSVTLEIPQIRSYRECKKKETRPWSFLKTIFLKLSKQVDETKRFNGKIVCLPVTHRFYVNLLLHCN